MAFMDKYVQNIIVSSGELEQEKKYWIKKLDGLSISTIPEDCFEQNSSKKKYLTEIKKMTGDTFDKIMSIGKDSEYAIYMILLSCVKVLFSKYLNTEDITIGSGEEIIPVEYKGEDFSIFLNYSFISDFLTVIKNKNVIFEFKDPQSTVTIREEDNDDFIYIMMPMTS